MVQSLPGFLDLCLDVCSPCQVLGDVYTEVLEAAHPLHRGPADHKRSVGLLLSLPEVYNQLFGFAHVQRDDQVQSVMIWVAMSSAGVGPLCFLKTNIPAPVNQDILEHFMLPSADQLFKDADFFFQQDLAPAHTAKSTKSWLNDHGVGVLDWPANSPDLNPIENLLSRGKMQMS